MHLSQVLAVFWLVVAAAQSGTAFDAFGVFGGPESNLARGAAAATAGVAGAAAGALELKKGLLVKEALIKMIKAKLTASGIIGNEVVKDAAFDKAYNGGYAKYAPVATVAAVPAVPVVAGVGGTYYDRGYKDDKAGAVAAAAKTKGLIALLASLALAKEGIRKANDVKYDHYRPSAAVVAAPVYAAAPIAGVRIEGGRYISNKDEIVTDKALAVTGEKILKGLLVKLGLVGAGAAADAVVKKLALTADADILPLFLAAALLDERGWVPDAFVKDGVSLWGQLLPNFSESAKARIFNDILI